MSFSSSNSEALACREGFIVWCSRALQLEIEGDGGTVSLAAWHGQQAVARTEGKIVCCEGIVAKIDLRGQRAVTRRFDEEMDMGGAIAMTAQRLHQMIGRAAGGHAIAIGHLRMESVSTIINVLACQSIFDLSIK